MPGSMAGRRSETRGHDAKSAPLVQRTSILAAAVRLVSALNSPLSRGARLRGAGARATIKLYVREERRVYNLTKP